MECKKAIISGGSRGIGRAISLQLASEGYDIAFSYNSAEEEARKLAEVIRNEYGRKCFYYQATLQNKGAPKKFFDEAIADLGGVSALICVAGLTRMGSILEMPTETMDEVFDLNVKCNLLLTSYASRHMVEHGVKGNIIFISSVHGDWANSHTAYYGSSKACLNRAVQSLACELGSYGIRVNSVAPGRILARTWEERPEFVERSIEIGKLFPLGRIGQPVDISNAVSFLVSDEAKYITGITLKVEAGMSLPGMPESKDPEYNVRVWGFRDHYGFRRAKREQKQDP